MSETNQCAGCQQGFPKEGNLHRKGEKYYVVCSKDKYSSPQPKEERKCDGCKLYGNMGVHSFTCPIRKQPIEISFLCPQTKEELQEIKSKSEVINDSLWYTNPKDIQKAIEAAEKRGYERGLSTIEPKS